MKFSDIGIRVISCEGEKDGILGADEGLFTLETNIPLGDYDIYCTNAVDIQYTIQNGCDPSKEVEGKGTYVTRCRAREWGGDSGIPVGKLREGTVLYKASFLESRNFPVFFDIQDFFNNAGDIKKKIGAVSDGYHTFDELYHYRMLYNAAFFNEYAKSHPDAVVKSKRHDDGEPCFGGGWFIVQANLPTGQISNHYEEKFWDLFKIPEADKAFAFDGHNPEIAAERLENFLKL